MWVSENNTQVVRNKKYLESGIFVGFLTA
jgi:hypothetical protein